MRTLYLEIGGPDGGILQTFNPMVSRLYLGTAEDGDGVIGVNAEGEQITTVNSGSDCWILEPIVKGEMTSYLEKER